MGEQALIGWAIFLLGLVLMFGAPLMTNASDKGIRRMARIGFIGAMFTMMALLLIL